MTTRSRNTSAATWIVQFFLTAAVLSMPLVAGCDSSGPEEDPAVTGNYSGIITFNNGVLGDFDVSLTESAGDVSGNGTISGPGGTATLLITGTHNHPDISLTFSSPGFESFNLTGTVSDDGDSITGDLSGSDLDGINVALVRE